MSGVKGMMKEDRFRERYAKRKETYSRKLKDYEPMNGAGPAIPSHPLPPKSRFYLMNEQGDYLKFDGVGLTKKKKEAFWAIPAQISQMRKKDPYLKNFKEVPFDDR